MKTFIIDCSVAAKWLFREKDSKQAEKLLQQLPSFKVPDLFVIELDSVITKKVRKRELDSKTAPEIRKKARKLPYDIVKYSEIHRFAFDISISLPVTLYDATYVATAVEKDGILYTADKRLAHGLSNTMFKEYVRKL